MLTYPDRGRGDPLGCLNVVPHTQVVFGSEPPAHHFLGPTARRAEVEDHRLRAAFDIVQMQLEEEEVDTQLRKDVGVFPSDHFLMGK